MKRIFLLLAVIAAVSCTPKTQPVQEVETNTETDVTGMSQKKFTLDELLEWKFYGIGKFYNDSGRQAILQEDENSKGAMIVSPASYPGDVVVRYKVMTLNAATVMITMLSVSDLGESAEISFPANYDGGMGFLEVESENYFVAYRNSPHVTTPFIRRHPEGTTMVLAESDDMIPGVYYDIETGRVGDKLWLKIDGELIVETTDPEIISGGRVVIRTRGVVGHPAECMIKDMVIYSAK